MKTINEIYPDYLEFLYLKNKITTIEGINYRFKKYILPFFGDKKINKITTQDYINFQTYLKNLNLSPSFYESTHLIIKKFFNYLSMLYNIENVVDKVGYQKTDIFYSTTQKKGTFSRKEYKKFIKKVDNKIYHALFNLLFYSGLRKGEALALKVSDLKNGYVVVNKTITTHPYDGTRLITTPKTKSSIRKIKLDFFTNLELEQLIKHYKRTYNDFNQDFFLFGAKKPIACTTLSRKKNEYCKKAGVKQIRIHDFRHSHATMLYKEKIDFKSIQKRLGHADISTTLNTYVHSDEKEEKKLIKMINFRRI